MTVTDFFESIRAGAFTSLGGYPKFWLMDDGDCLCHACAKSECFAIGRSIRDNAHDGWKVEAVDVNWESEMWCGNCNETIESAYGTAEKGE